MKKIFSSFIVILSAMSFVACDMNNPNEDNFIADSQSGWVGFANPGSLVQGNANCGTNEILVPIELHAPVNTDGLDVLYTITDVIGTSAGTITSSARIPEGSRTGNLVITYPETLTSSLEFTVTLTGTSRPNVFIAGTTASGTNIEVPDAEVEQTVTVRVNTGFRDRFLGVYDVIETGTDGNQFTYQSVAERGAADNELIFSNIFDQEEELGTTTQTRVFVNSDGTVTFPGFTDNLLFTTSGGAPVFFQGLNGTVSTNPCEGEMDIDFNLRVGPTGGTTVGPINIVLRRQ